jgi:hypothetical protein
MVSPTILSVRQRTVSHTRITTAALSFTLSGLMATPDPSLALTTLHFTFTPSPPLEKKFFLWPSNLKMAKKIKAVKIAKIYLAHKTVRMALFCCTA